MGNQEKNYYLKLEDFKILSMFGECEIDVTNSKVKIKLDKNENQWWKKFEVQKQKTIRDLNNKWYYLILWNQNFNILLNKHDFCVFRSHHIQIERLIKVIHFTRFLLSIIRRNKRGRSYPTILPTFMGSRKTVCIACIANLHFQAGQLGLHLQAQIVKYLHFWNHFSFELFEAIHLGWHSISHFG